MKRILISSRSIDRNCSRGYFKKISLQPENWLWIRFLSERHQTWKDANPTASFRYDDQQIIKRSINKIFEKSDSPVYASCSIYYYEIEVEDETDLVYAKLGGDQHLQFFNKPKRTTFSQDYTYAVCWMCKEETLEQYAENIFKIFAVEPAKSRPTISYYLVERDFRDLQKVATSLSQNKNAATLERIWLDVKTEHERNTQYNSAENHRVSKERMEIVDFAVKEFMNNAEILIEE